MNLPHPTDRPPHPMNLYALPPHVPFLDAVAADWLHARPTRCQRATA